MAASPLPALLTIAPTRTGKSTMHVKPAESAVVLDPSALSSDQSVRTNPLDGVTDSQSALELAEIAHPR
jgi:type IV secretory pathway TraG/TraD family ATPase VirD4